MGPGSALAIARLSGTTSELKARARILATRSRPSYRQYHPRREQRAQGKPGVLRTRSLVCSKKKHTSKHTTGTPKQPGLPCATVYGLLRALPGVRDLIVTVVCRFVTCRLSASPGAPGPHGLAVRRTCRSSAHMSAPSTAASIASRPTLRDDRPTRPSGRSGMPRKMPVIWGRSQAKF